MTSVSTDKERHIVVLMTYHTLVDRDPKYVHYCWGCKLFSFVLKYFMWRTSNYVLQVVS